MNNSSSPKYQTVEVSIQLKTGKYLGQVLQEIPNLFKELQQTFKGCVSERLAVMLDKNSYKTLAVLFKTL